MAPQHAFMSIVRTKACSVDMQCTGLSYEAAYLLLVCYWLGFTQCTWCESFPHPAYRQRADHHRNQPDALVDSQLSGVCVQMLPAACLPAALCAPQHAFAPTWCAGLGYVKGRVV